MKCISVETLTQGLHLDCIDGDIPVSALLTLGSLYALYLPARLFSGSDISQSSSPITAAEPLPILTGSPVKPKWHHEYLFIKCQMIRQEEEKLCDGF